MSTGDGYKTANLISKKGFIIAATVIAAIFVIAIMAMRMQQGSNTSSLPPNKKVSTESTPSDRKISQEGLKLSAEIIPANETKNVTMFKNGTTIRLVIKLENNSTQNARFLSLKTSINSSTLINKSNFKGLTGISTENEKLVINNVSIAAGQAQEISLDGILDAKDVDKLDLTVSLTESSGQEITASDNKTYRVDNG